MGFITIDGENQLAAKQGGGPPPLNIVSFVLANIDGLGAEPVNRIEAMPAPADIMDTLPVTKSGYVNTNQVVYSLVMDSAIGDYDFNWVGLVDDEGVLIAVTYTPLIQKRKTVGAVPGNNLTRNFLIAFSGIQATAAIAVPAETWQIDFTARLWGIDERERLSNYDVYGAAAFFDTGWSVVRQGATTNYDVLPGVGYVGGIRLASAVTQVISVVGPPKSVWLDVSLQGDISDVSAVVDFIIDAVAHEDYTDANGFNHYLTKIAEVAADGSVTDFRVAAQSVEDHEAKADPHSQYLTPAEANALYEALGTVVDASETAKGIIELATNAEAAAGVDTLRALTPAALASLFGASSQASDGYARIPIKIGGAMDEIIIQWGADVTSPTPGTPVAVTFPVAFPTAGFRCVAGNSYTSSAGTTVSAVSITTTGFSIGSNIANLTASWFAVGY